MKRLETIIRNIPLTGIFAFALASVWSLYQMFYNNALHPTWLYMIPACLVELVTAWLVYQAVGSVRVTTDTKALKRDKAFHRKVMVWCILLALPTLYVSGAANYYEFQEHFGLALLFPASSVACAVALAIPHAKQRQADERLAEERDKHAKELEKLRAESAKEPQVIVKTLTLDERRAQLVDIWSQDGDKPFTEIAPMFGVSRQTIGNDFKALRKAGKVRRNGRKEVVVIAQ